MTEQPSSTDNRKKDLRSAVGWLLFPISLFPLAALLTYDWRVILQTPAAPSSNWVGALGDHFAYYGYNVFGLAIWAVPVLCIIAGLMRVLGKRFFTRARFLWTALITVSAACLFQSAQNHAPGIAALIESLHIPAAGGVIGYLLMTRCLASLLSDFGASVIMLLLLITALIALVGLANLSRALLATLHWATMRETRASRSRSTDSTDDEDDDQAEREAQYRAAIQAREEAKRQREEEKRLAREEKLRLKEEAKRERERERERRANPGIAAVSTPTEEVSSPLATIRQQATIASASPNQAGEKPADDKGPYLLPPIDLLNPIPHSSADHGDVNEMSQQLIKTLKLFNIDATLSYTVQGPVVTKYAIELTPGTRYSTVTNISDELMGALHAKSLRIEAPIPGEDRVGIEVPNRKPAGISFREVFESDAWKHSKAELPLLFGKDAAGKELVADLASMPHMLVAGATGQGKSVCLNSLINGLLMTRTPEQVKFIMVDPKSVEFTPYAAIPHLLVPVITDNRKVVFSLRWAVAEMEKRLKLFANARVRNIYDFNHRKTLTQPDMFGSDEPLNSGMPKTVPYIVIIIDEVADLMSTSAKDVVPDIGRLTAKARAAGIHLILATQRPDAKVITGTIKANIPGRVAFKTSQAIDSRTILDEAGAENLIGRGDMLFRSKDGLLIRAQGAWISDEEINRITGFIEQHATTQFDETFARKLGRVKEAAIDDPFADNTDDPDNQKSESVDEASATREKVKAAKDADLYKRALECIINTNRASTSHFQRRLGIGYNPAAKLCDKLEEAGIIGPQKGAGPREILMSQDQLLAIFNGNAVDDGQSAAPSESDESPTAEASGQQTDIFNQQEEPA